MVRKRRRATPPHLRSSQFAGTVAQRCLLLQALPNVAGGRPPRRVPGGEVQSGIRAISSTKPLTGSVARSPWMIAARQERRIVVPGSGKRVLQEGPKLSPGPDSPPPGQRTRRAGVLFLVSPRTVGASRSARRTGQISSPMSHTSASEPVPLAHEVLAGSPNQCPATRIDVRADGRQGTQQGIFVRSLVPHSAA